MSKAAQTPNEIENYFSCAITDDLISECDACTSNLLVDTTFKGVYWEASVCFDYNDFILSAYTESVNGVKGVEVLRFPAKKISEAKISNAKISASSGKEIKSEFKFSLSIGSGFGIMIFIAMLINSEQEYSEIGTALSISLFLAIGLTLVIYFFQIIFEREEIIEINLITDDKRKITLFSNKEEKDLITEVLLNNSIKVRE